MTRLFRKQILSYHPISSVLVLIALLFDLGLTQCFSQSTFIKRVAGNEYEFLYTMIPTYSGGYLAAGHSSSYGNFVSEDIYLVKYDSMMTIEWSNSLGPSGEDWASEVIQSPDSGFFIVGTTRIWSETKFYVSKRSPTGALEWMKGIGDFTADQWGTSIIFTTDGNIVACGYGLFDTTTPYLHIRIVKLDLYGNIIWAYGSSGNSFEKAYDMIPTIDNGFIIVGSIRPLNSNNTDLYLAKFNEFGNPVWQKAIGNTIIEQGFSIINTSDGGFAITGSVQSMVTGLSDLYIIKTDSIGNETWSQTMNGIQNNDNGNAIFETNDQGLLVAGKISSSNGGNFDNEAIILKLNSSGALEWSKSFGGPGNDWFNSVLETADGGILLAGITNSYGSIKRDGLVIKLDSLGNDCMSHPYLTPTFTPYLNNTSNASIQLDTIVQFTNIIPPLLAGGLDSDVCSSVGYSDHANSSIDIFPNPNNGNFQINSNQNNDRIYQLEIFSLNGKLLFSKTLFNTGTIEYCSLPSFIESGVYYCKFKTRETNYFKRLVLIKI